MMLERRLSALERIPGDHVVALGSFAAIHRGDQRVLGRAVERARELGGKAIALLPVATRSNRTDPQITSLQQRVRLVSAMGCDVIVFQRWTSLGDAWDALGAGSGWQSLRARVVVVTRSLASSLRTNRLLPSSAMCGFELDTVDSVRVAGREVTSSAVRDAIERAAFDEVRAMLGRNHAVSGRVRAGYRRGRTLGFPTANLRVGTTVLPPSGVYAVRVWIGQARYDGVANLGIKPTFGAEELTLESHIFGFEGNLYGERIDVEFVARLRSERKFGSVDELRAQIERDADAARALLRDT